MGLCGRLLLCAWGETPPLPLVGGSRGVLDGRRGGRVLRAARGTSSAPSGHLPQRGRQGRGCGRAGDLIRPFGAPSPEGKAGARLRPRGDLIRRLRRHLPQRGRQGRGCGRAGTSSDAYGATFPRGEGRGAAAAARGTSSAPSGHLPQRGRQGRGCGIKTSPYLAVLTQ